MQNEAKAKIIRNHIELAIIVILCAFILVFDFIDISYSKDAFYNRMISKIVQQSCGVIAGILILVRLRVKLFGKPKKLLYLIPCMIIAVDNFQFCAYFSGKMQLVRTSLKDFTLFGAYCLSIGLFEEIVFRGIIFSTLAGFFGNTRKGFLTTYILSSCVFGVAHLFNGFSLGTLLQVAYTILTGGLFAFCLIKTKNIFCCAFVHAIYNFCGLLFDVQGLGSGVVFDMGTTITMLIVSIIVGIFVLYKVFKYTDAERNELYDCLGVKEKKID